MKRAAIYLALLITGSILLLIIDPNNQWFGIIGGFSAAVLLALLDSALTNLRYIRFFFYIFRYRGSRVRISAAYLFRIKIRGNYLLIKGRRFPQYQPVGGVYKSSSSAREFLNRIEATDDDLISLDDVSEHDLRIRIPMRRLIDFVRWFESGVSRETSPWREFYEELVKPGIISSQNFPFIYHDFVTRTYHPLRHSDHAQSLEILISDIYVLLLTESQELEIEKLIGNESSDIIWVSEETIRRRGAIPGKDQSLVIAETARWIV
ncbi:hypothetical protein [Nonomuraea sp. LPB2021202275-12-8]|uniref:SMODS-associated NUDIX domain-containing protein n=1 Tax=Nonomuraea sp. LPB2021202275-12-8 TaxID=3120159 RepID=UPI003FA5E847